MEMHLLQVFEQDAALALDDRLRQPGGAGGIEHPERVFEVDAVELEFAARVEAEHRGRTGISRQDTVQQPHRRGLALCPAHATGLETVGAVPA